MHHVLLAIINVILTIYNITHGSILILLLIRKINHRFTYLQSRLWSRGSG